MTAAEALGKWSDACAVTVLGGTVWLNGNREPLAITLSTHVDATIDATEFAPPRCDWKAVVKVTPQGEAKASFYLCVE